MNIRNLEGFKVYILESLCSDDRKTGEDCSVRILFFTVPIKNNIRTEQSSAFLTIRNSCDVLIFFCYTHFLTYKSGRSQEKNVPLPWQ